METGQSTKGDAMETKAIKTVIGYAAHARLLTEIEGELGYVRRFVATPYAYSPTHTVYLYRGVSVVIAETKHRRYEVIPVPATLSVRNTDEMATQDFLAARKGGAA